MLKGGIVMNIKVATKYQINEYLKSIKIFYLVVILVLIFFGVITAVNSSSNFYSTGEIEGSTIIFLFILGLNSFKETFLMMLQNGTTRRSMFIGRLITILATSVFMAVVDRFVVNITLLLNDVSESFRVGGMYEEFFVQRAESLHIVVRNLEAILITIGMYAAVMVAGYLITSAYYRMNKILKIAVSIGVPTSVLILLPVLDAVVFDGRIAVAVSKFLRFVFGGQAGNPYNLLLSCIIFIVVGIGLTWLLIRKSVEKS
jgi:hypothetical protein